MRHLEQLYLSRLRLYHLQFFHSSSSVNCYTYNDNISTSHLPENYIMTILKSAFDSVLYAAQKLKEEEEQREDALNAAKVK